VPHGSILYALERDTAFVQFLVSIYNSLIDLPADDALLNGFSLFLKYARYHYICYRLILRIKMGKKVRDEYIKKMRLSPIDFLPERPYVMCFVSNLAAALYITLLYWPNH
jgi:hypothetical protein